MTDIVRFMTSPSAPAALVRQHVPAQPADKSALSLDATLAFVERAAETLRTLKTENEAAGRRIVVLHEELQRERQDRHAEAEKIEQFVKETQRKLAASEAQVAEAKALATAAIRRCEDMTAGEAKALQRAQAAETRAADIEDRLLGLQQAIAFEFSSVLS